MPPETVAEPFGCTRQSAFCANRIGAIWFYYTEWLVYKPQGGRLVAQHGVTCRQTVSGPFGCTTRSDLCTNRSGAILLRWREWLEYKPYRGHLVAIHVVTYVHSANFGKYMACFRATIYQDSSTLTQLFYKESLRFDYLIILHHVKSV